MTRRQDADLGKEDIPRGSLRLESKGKPEFKSIRQVEIAPLLPSPFWAGPGPGRGADPSTCAPGVHVGHFGPLTQTRSRCGRLRRDAQGAPAAGGPGAARAPASAEAFSRAPSPEDGSWGHLPGGEGRESRRPSCQHPPQGRDGIFESGKRRA